MVLLRPSVRCRQIGGIIMVGVRIEHLVCQHQNVAGFIEWLMRAPERFIHHNLVRNMTGHIKETMFSL